MNEEIRYDSQKIVDVEISSEIRKAFLDYSMSVIVSRAQPPSVKCLVTIIRTATHLYMTQW